MDSPVLSRSQRLVVNRNKIKQYNLESSLRNTDKDRDIGVDIGEEEEHVCRETPCNRQCEPHIMSTTRSPVSSPSRTRKTTNSLHTNPAGSPSSSPALRRAVLTKTLAPSPRGSPRSSPGLSRKAGGSGKSQTGSPGQQRKEPWKWEGGEEEGSESECSTPYSISCAMKVADSKGAFENNTGKEGLRAWMGRGSPKNSPKNSPLLRHRVPHSP